MQLKSERRARTGTSHFRFYLHGPDFLSSEYNQIRINPFSPLTSFLDLILALVLAPIVTISHSLWEEILTMQKENCQKRKYYFFAPQHALKFFYQNFQHKAYQNRRWKLSRKVVWKKVNLSISAQGDSHSRRDSLYSVLLECMFGKA